uniref:Uncharacterized protein n=1 Tax=Timema tahoe TaxID=61484 RepID=A0A7R9IQG9_9NEOP|nr:unnamed protein product [Timema tahoe]
MTCGVSTAEQQHSCTVTSNFLELTPTVNQKDEMEEINTSEDKDYNVKTEEQFYGKIETFSEELSSERSVIKEVTLLVTVPPELSHWVHQVQVGAAARAQGTSFDDRAGTAYRSYRPLVKCFYLLQVNNDSTRTAVEIGPTMVYPMQWLCGGITINYTGAVTHRKILKQTISYFTSLIVYSSRMRLYPFLASTPPRALTLRRDWSTPPSFPS